MRCLQGACLTAVCSLAACGSSVTAIDTGLSGTVLRGPVTPVCRTGTACEEPFSARFVVRQGSRTIATFQSDGEGRFETRIPAGSYLVVPSAEAPVFPHTQSKLVEVGSTGLTTVVLRFDTGIR
jgi:hypothetical protein